MVTATFVVLNALCLTCIYSVSKHKYIPGKLALAVHFVAYIGKLSGSNFDRYRPPKMQFCFFYQSIQTNEDFIAALYNEIFIASSFWIHHPYFHQYDFLTLSDNVLKTNFISSWYVWPWSWGTLLVRSVGTAVQTSRRHFRNKGILNNSAVINLVLNIWNAKRWYPLKWLYRHVLHSSRGIGNGLDKTFLDYLLSDFSP